METSEEQNEKEPNRSPIRYLFILPLVAQLGASVYLVLSLIRLNVLQIWQLAVVIGLLAIIFIINLCILLIRKKGVFSKIFATLIALILAGLCFFIAQDVQSATGFISEVSGDHYEVQIYEIRVLKDSEYKNLGQLYGQKVGFMSTNPNLEETKNRVKEKLDAFDAVDYEEIGGMLASLYNQEIPAVVLARSYLSFLEETNSTFEEDTVVLHEIEITVKDLDLRQPVNVVEEPFIVYISGSDSRGTINEVADSDVNILAVINPKQGKILLVNVPRDYEVQIYGTTGLTDKLKSAGRFSIETSKKTIEELLDIKINYTIKVGFQAIRQLVNAIDGIDIESDMELSLRAIGENRTCYVTKGWIHLDGTCALAYSRHRKTLQGGDLDRGKHQQVVLTAIINKITNLHYVTLIPQILSAAKDTFQTSLTEKEITDFIRWQLGELKHWKIESIQIGTQEHALVPTYTAPNQNLWVYLRDEASETKAKEKIAEYLTE